MYSLPDMTGRIVVLSGATSGIGRHAAISLARANARLIAVARSQDKAEQLLADCKAEAPAASVEIVMGDLMERSGVHQVADQVEEKTDKIDLLLNNAGALFSSHALTTDGFEQTWALNHLGYQLLTTRLISRVREGRNPRIVNVASNAHKGARMNWEDLQYVHSQTGSGWKTYCHSKLANILFTKGLAARLEGTGVVANCIHPGFVATGFNRNNGGIANFLMTLSSPFARTPAKGAETLLWAAASPDAGSLNGEYLADCKVRQPTRWARSHEDAERLWQITEEMTETTGSWAG